MLRPDAPPPNLLAAGQNQERQMEKTTETSVRKLWRILRRAIIALITLVLALSVLVAVYGAWKGESSKEELLDADGIHVVPHLLRNTYTGDVRFEVACDATEKCLDTAQKICRDNVVILSEPQGSDGVWLLLAECEPGIEPDW